MCVNGSFMLRCEELISKAAHPRLRRAGADVHPCERRSRQLSEPRGRAELIAALARASQMSNPDKGWF